MRAWMATGRPPLPPPVSAPRRHRSPTKRNVTMHASNAFLIKKTSLSEVFWQEVLPCTPLTSEEEIHLVEAFTSQRNFYF